MKREKSGFTMVELLTVLAVITILVGLLIPALALVRRIAKQTQQKAQLTTIDLALLAFKQDYGDYPPSTDRDNQGVQYCGAQKLAEALLGKDLLGFHPDSLFRNDGEDKDGVDLYPPNLNPSNAVDEANLKKRLGPYLEATTANAFRLGDVSAAKPGLFDNTSPLDEDSFVICDVFGVKRITLAQGQSVKAGTPILYYKANTASKKFHQGRPLRERIYNCEDNLALINLGILPDAKAGVEHKLEDNAGQYFYDEEYKIVDPKASSTMAAGATWPHRPDSYILISAGADGEYGTQDDICNF
ncbi:MAG: prepilin-type N-terminal cleavage/methylation domain-containing protein [Planctomycetota bacterium]